MDARAAPAAVSPAKRRAALAPLDANAMPSPPRSAVKDLVTDTLVKGTTDAVAGTKRPADADADVDASPAAKKARVERDEDVQPTCRSESPDTSSIFDTSAGDASWATTATEPDVLESAAAVRPQAGSMTREQAREKVEILRLRLGLASYKLRTGQTAVPLAELQPRPLPPRRTAHVQTPAPPPPHRAGDAATAGTRSGAVSGLLSLARGGSS